MYRYKVFIDRPKRYINPNGNHRCPLHELKAMPTTTATATYIALEWTEIIPGVYHSNLPDGMTAEIITGFRDSWAIYDFEDNLIASGYGQGVPGCRVNVARVLNDL